jgi:transposase
MAVVVDPQSAEHDIGKARFGTTVAELRRLSAWLAERGAAIVVMESTAQYWKPVWYELEAGFELHLAQAQSNRAPGGRKSDFADARRLVRRFVAGELFLSYVPDAEQRMWRMLTRGKQQLTRERVRLHNQVESLLEDCRIKLSSVVSDLLGVSGRRILWAMARGIADPGELASLGDARLKCGRQALLEALDGKLGIGHRLLLRQALERLEAVDRQIQELDRASAEQMREHQQALIRLAEIPGLGLESAQQIVAEVGPSAAAFESAARMASWVGVCPGRHESAGHNASTRSAKGNKFLRRVLCQAAQAAVKTKDNPIQSLFRRWMVRLGYAKAIWAVAHRLCRIIWKVLHDGVSYAADSTAAAANGQRHKARRLVQALKRLGFSVQLTPTHPEPQQM